MGSIIEAADLPENEKVYLKKSWLGWRVVHPMKNEDGSFNWFNFLFGSKSNLVFLIILLLIGAGLYLGVNELIGQYKAVAASPCDFCSDCHSQCTKVLQAMRDPVRVMNFTLEVVK